MAGCDRTGIAANVASSVCGEFWQTMLAKNMRYSSLELLKRGCSLRFPSIGTYQHSTCAADYYIKATHIPSSSTNFCEKSLTTHLMPLRIHLAQLDSPGFISQRILCRLHSAPISTQHAIFPPQRTETKHSQARALEIFGGRGRSSRAVEERRSSPCDESKPAS